MNENERERERGERGERKEGERVSLTASRGGGPSGPFPQERGGNTGTALQDEVPGTYLHHE